MSAVASYSFVNFLQVTEHYRSGPDPRHVRQLVDEALKLLPGLRVVSFHGDSCVTLNTPTKKAPFIDTAMPGLIELKKNKENEMELRLRV